MADLTMDMLERAGIMGDLKSKRERVSKLESQSEAKDAELAAQFNAIEEKTGQKAEALRPMREQIVSKLKAAPSLKVEEETIPDYKRPTIDPKDLQESFGILLAASMLTGIASRQPFYTAANALTGAINGFMAQDAAIVKQSMAEFDKNVQSIKERNAQKRRAVEAAFQEYANDLQGLQTQMQIIATEYDDPIALATARAKSITEAKKLIDGNIQKTDQSIVRLEQTVERAYESASRLEEARARRADANARHAEALALQRERFDEQKKQAERKQKMVEERWNLQRQTLEAKIKESQSKAAKLPKAIQDKLDARNSILVDAEIALEQLKARPNGVGPHTALGDTVMSYLDEEGIPLRSALARLQANYSFGQGGKALTGTERQILAPVTEWRGKTAGAIEQQINSFVSSMRRENDAVMKQHGSIATPPAGGKQVLRTPGGATIEFE